MNKAFHMKKQDGSCIGNMAYILDNTNIVAPRVTEFRIYGKMNILRVEHFETGP